MLKVVDTGRNVRSYAIEVIKFDGLPDLSTNEEVVECLAQVSSVGFIMVSDFFVAALDGSNEIHEPIKVQGSGPQKSALR